jgi:hypothetical protein
MDDHFPVLPNDTGLHEFRERPKTARQSDNR